MNKTLLLRVWGGKFTKKELKWFAWSMLTITILLLVIARLYYPPSLNYSIFKDTLSYLGDFYRNPNGWVFFSIAMITMGFTFFSLSLYIHNRIKQVSKTISSIALIFMMIGSIGIIAVGFFPDDHGSNFIEDVTMGKIHNIIAMFGVFSTLAGLLTYSVIFIFDHYPKLRKTPETLFPNLITLPFFIIFAIIGIGLLISVLLVKSGMYEWPGQGIMTFTFWEWLLSLMFIVIIYRLALGLPYDLAEIKAEEKITPQPALNQVSI
jgi:hypothetical protein